MYSPEKIGIITLKEIIFIISDKLFFQNLLMEIRGKTISNTSFMKKGRTREERLLNNIARLENNFLEFNIIRGLQ